MEAGMAKLRAETLASWSREAQDLELSRERAAALADSLEPLAAAAATARLPCPSIANPPILCGRSAAGGSRAMSDPIELDLVGLAAAIRNKELSAREAAETCLARLDAAQPRLNCVIRLDREDALAAADAADAALARGAIPGPLHGVPLAHKDMFYRAGKVATCGSQIRRDFVPDRTATVLRRLDAAGALQLAALNMNEFAYGPTGHNAHFGPCRNPWSPDHITGGSSSGSGAAVAARLVFGALGSDTGGSVRIPAALCGVVGMKTSSGRVSRYGAMPLSFSLDTVGPLARTVRDCALLTEIIAGADPDDPTAGDVPVPRYAERLEEGVRGVRIGVPTTYFLDGMTEETQRLYAAVLDTYRALGAEIVEVTPPGVEEMSALSSIVIAVEAATIHDNWLRTRAQDYSEQVRTRLESGLHHPATRYLEAVMLRARHLDAFGHAVFDRVEAMLAPVLPIPTPTIAETDVGGSPAMTATLGLLIRCCRPINYLGLPSLAFPAGFTANGLPFGVQLVGRPYAEAPLFRIARAYERESEWHKRRPPGF
jgi:aspartyl-tRNA(Asn)/glutamyl-tRNA(Gln) amidotransferase subunit A